MELERLSLLKAKHRMISGCIKDILDIMEWANRMGIPCAFLEPYRGELVTRLSLLDSEIATIRDAIKRLPDETLSQVLLYRYDEELKVNEISEKLHYSNQWVHVLLKRASALFEQMV